jgi:hypothetical protein
MILICASFQCFDVAADILRSVSPNKSFADVVARHDILWPLVSILERPPDAAPEMSAADHNALTRRESLAWAILETLSSTPSVAATIVSSSYWLEFLGVLVGHHSFTKSWAARTGAAKALSRLLWDPSTGSVMGKFFNSNQLLVKCAELTRVSL